MPYYLNPHCDGECRGHDPAPAPAPAPHRPPKAREGGQTRASAAHVVLTIVLLLVGLAALGGAGLMGLRYKRELDQRKSYKEMGPRIGDPLLQ